MLCFCLSVGLGLGKLMKIEFENGSVIESIDTGGNVKSERGEEQTRQMAAEMAKVINEDMMQYARDKYGVDFSEVKYDIALESYQQGYSQALADINTPLKAITEDWSPSVCPRCNERYYDYEPCDDGYYTRATSIERCPFCGQKLDWNGEN